MKGGIGAFKQLYVFRHWLAHGRHWTQKSGINPPPEVAFVAWHRGYVNSFRNE